jgi:hypothetical protein
LPQLPWKQKRGGFNFLGISLIKLHEAYLETKFRPIRRFLYFGGHFGFKMDAIANRSGRNMVQHILLPVNIHFQIGMCINGFEAWKFQNASLL